MLAVMKRRIGQDICKEVYVVGLISTEFKPSTKSSLNTRAKIRDKIKSKLGHHPSVYFYDTLIERHIHLVLLKDLTNPLARATILCTSMNSGILGTPQDITNLLASADMKEIKYTQFVKR